MLTVEVRPSLRMVQQIAAIERFCGSWDRLSQSAVLASDHNARVALLQGVCGIADLDQSSSPAVTRCASELSRALQLELRAGPHTRNGVHKTKSSSPIDEALRGLSGAHEFHFELDSQSIQQIYGIISRDAVGSERDLSYFRSTSIRFLSPSNESVFPTVSGFLVEQRLQELIDWTAQELDAGRFHPLLVIGVFHLLFLQISPFPQHNHSVALTLSWQLLKAHGYSFVAYRHFAPIFSDTSTQYFSSLRQAEKTAGGNWSTLNIWLEYFFGCLASCCKDLNRKSEKSSKASRLSAVQRDIIDVIRENGSATREVIVSTTGINLSTVKYNLSVLSTNGHLTRHGGGRTTSYSLL